MNETPLVSVVMIFLNAERFIAEAIESVRAQTDSRWELLLVDDGSTDGSTSLAREYAQLEPKRIRYLEHPGHENRGMSASRNRGIAAACGTFVTYLDADDVWQPDKIADQVAILERYPEVAYVYGPLEVWFGWTGRAEDRARDFIQRLGVLADRVIYPPEVVRAFLTSEMHIPSGIMVRRAIIEALGGYNESFRGMYEDVIFHCKVCLRHPVYAASKSWYRYRQHPESNSGRDLHDTQHHAARARYLEWLTGELRTLGLTDIAVWKALKRERRYYTNPHAHRLISELQRAGGATRRMVRGAARRFVPESLKRTLRRVRRSFQPSVAILTYHRVTTLERDVWDLCVTREHFEQQLEVLRRCAPVLHLSDLVERLRSGRHLPAKSVVITFDDGYEDNLHEAAPALEKYGLPATVFMTTGDVGRSREFWWDALERIFLSMETLPPELALKVNGAVTTLRFGEEPSASRRAEVHDEVYQLLQQLPDSQRDPIMRELADWANVALTPRATHRALDEDGIRALANAPGIELGAHTITHAALSSQPPAVQREEMLGSKSRIEELTGREISTFSYPYGYYSPVTMDLARDCGFACACACEERVAGRASDLMRLPRLFVRDWNGDTFAHHLGVWLEGQK